jgi:hypothetical protein
LLSLRVCKADIKAKGGYFEQSKIYLDLVNTFFGYWLKRWASNQKVAGSNLQSDKEIICCSVSEQGS